VIHVIRHVFNAARHGFKHSSRVAFKSPARVTPLAWTRAAKVNKHTASFWKKVGRWGFKFPRA
jgi:hypothetical protein